jgi:hypothetical protein
MKAAWHRRTLASPAHRWFRSLVAEVARGLSSDTPRCCALPTLGQVMAVQLTLKLTRMWNHRTRLQTSVALTRLCSVGLKHQLSVDGDFNVVSYDDTGALARVLPNQAKVLPID